MSAQEYSKTPMCSVAISICLPTEDHVFTSATCSTLQNDATISYTQNPETLRPPVVAGRSDFQWLHCVCRVYFWAGSFWAGASGTLTSENSSWPTARMV